MEKKMTDLPTTDSVAELAAFWQHHEVVDYEDQLEEVSEPVFEPIEHVFVPLSHEYLRALRKRADREHLSSEALVQKWVREHLDENRQKGRARQEFREEFRGHT